MNDTEKQIVSAKLRLAAHCLNFAARGIELNDKATVDRELAEFGLHINDAQVVIKLANEAGR